MKPDHKRLLFKTVFIFTNASALLVVPFLLFGHDRRVIFAIMVFIALNGLGIIVVMHNRCRHCGYRMKATDLPTAEMTQRIRRWPRLADFDHCPGCGKDPFSEPLT